jgi:hypothetical protein
VPDSPGAIPTNLYQGTRSEYLAQYVFSMFGSASLLPHQEDYGLDLACTLTKRAGKRGQRSEPYAYYAVQVKSTGTPWIFDGLGSVRWILEYPAPLLLCVVSKKATTFTIYQLISRFQAAIIPDPPSKLTLLPGAPGEVGHTDRPRVGWTENGEIELGPPILHFKLKHLLKKSKFELYKSILDYWVTGDLKNIVARQMGMQVASGPTMYATNKLPPDSGFASFAITNLTPELRTSSAIAAARQANWVAEVLSSENDTTGALLAALLIRRLIPGDDPDRSLGFSPAFLYGQLHAIGCRTFDLPAVGGILSDMDAILGELDHRIAAAISSMENSGQGAAPTVQPPVPETGSDG